MMVASFLRVKNNLIKYSELTNINITGALVINNVWFVRETRVFVTPTDITTREGR
jgi:hypothetical protein